MQANFDFIAVPKGQAPGGPVQASDGSWYIVTPLSMTLVEAIEHMRRMRAGKPASHLEVKQAAEHLSEQVLKQLD